jgi:ParB family chromosome partitioning protein
MSKFDELRRTAGANVTESASRRDTPVVTGVPTLSALSSSRMAGVARSKTAMEIPVDRIQPDPDQPREEFDEAGLERLAESLKTRGQLQPARVRWDEESQAYVIVCGERRWRAARMAGLPTLSCVVHEGVLDAGDLLAIQLIENCVREDLNKMEQARAYRTLMDRSGWSGNRLAQELGIDQSSVVQALKMLEMPSDVQSLVEQGELAPSKAYEISKVADREAQSELARRVVTEGMNRAETVAAVRTAKTPTKGRGAAKAKGKPTRLPAEMKFRGSSGCRVVVHTGARHNLDDVLDALLGAVDRVRAEKEGRAQDAA